MPEGRGLEYRRDLADAARQGEKAALSEEDLNHIPAGQPFSRLFNRYHGGIDFYGKDGQLLVGVQYSDLRSPHHRPEANLLVVFFEAIDGHIKVVMRGRNLLRLYRYIRDHRMSWIQEIPEEKESNELRQSNEPIVNEITVDEVKERGSVNTERARQALLAGAPPSARIPPPQVRIVEPT